MKVKTLGRSMAVACALAAAAPGSAMAGTQSFPFISNAGNPPNRYTEWQVPAGVSQATFDLYGAQGGSGPNGPGGAGAHVRSTIAVTPGETLRVYIGGQDTFNGGGPALISGGGASDVRRAPYGDGTQGTSNDRLVVAGGGGGAGSVSGSGARAAGGAAGSAGANAPGNGGGGGGAGTSSTGGSGGAGAADAGANPTSCQAGAVGTIFRGGSPGISQGTCFAGGGGGGGLYGGGGGGAGYGTNGGGGGGGGSSLGTVIDTLRTGNGEGSVTYTDPPAPSEPTPSQPTPSQPAPIQPAPPAPTPTPTPEKPAISGSTSAGTTTVTSAGAFTLAKRVAACGGAGPNCAVTTKVTGTVVSKGGKKKTVVLGSSSFTVKAGRDGKVAVKLNAAGRKTLRTLRKVKVKVAVNVRRGGVTAKRTFTVTLKAPKAKKRKR